MNWSARSKTARRRSCYGVEFFAAIERHPVRTEIRTYDLARAHRALAGLRSGLVRGAVVLMPKR